MNVAIAGLGAIGWAVADAIDKGMPGVMLSAVSTRDLAGAAERLRVLAHPPACVALACLADYGEVVVECAGPQVLREIAAPVLASGRKLVALSAGAFVSSPELALLWQRYRAQIHIPSGALGGLDAVAAMAEGHIDAVRLVTTKPAAALRGAPGITQLGIDVQSLTRPTQVFAGTAADAIQLFPDNLNVAAALALAGVGAHRTMVELWLDPHARTNRHEVEVQADSGLLRFSMDAAPSANPMTSSLAAQSVLALLRRLPGVRMNACAASRP